MQKKVCNEADLAYINYLLISVSKSSMAAEASGFVFSCFFSYLA